MNTRSKWDGAFTALVTPLTKNGDFDDDSARRIVWYQVAHGIDGFVIGGTTGESPTVTTDELRRYVDIAREVSAGKLPIIVGTGTNATRSTIEKTKTAMAWGIDAVLVVCPYYNKPTQEGLFRHFLAVFEECGAPIIAYNVPGRTVSDLLPDTIARLVDAGAIVGVKDATANMQRAVETLQVVRPDRPFAFLSGDDFTILPFIAVGGCGVISVVSNLAPHETAELVRQTRANAFLAARALQARIGDLSRALFSVASPIPVKAGMSMLGLCEPTMRLPLVEADDKTRAAVEDAMRRFGLVLPNKNDASGRS